MLLARPLSQLLTSTLRSLPARLFSSLFSQTVLLDGVVMTQMQHLAFGPVESHATEHSPSIQPIQIPL